jgi:hypothetical protein
MSITGLLNVDLFLKIGDSDPVIAFKRQTKIPAIKKQNVKIPVGGFLAVTVICKGETIGLCEIRLTDAYGKEAEIRVSVNHSMLVNVSVAKPAVGNYRSLVGLAPDVIEQLRKLEDEMAANDKAEVEIDEAKNELEALVFQADNAMDRDYPEYFSTEQRSRGDVSAVKEWMEANQENRIEKAEYEEKIGIVKSVLTQGMDRKEKYVRIAERAPELKRMTKELLRRIAEKRGPEVEKVRTDLEVAIGRLDGLMRCDKSMDPGFALEELEKWIYQIDEWARRA